MTDTLGKRLAQARREHAARIHRDVTGPDLAAAVGVSPSAYYKWETDETRPKRLYVERLAALLGVTVGWLDYGQPPKLAPGVAPLGEDAMDVVNPSVDRKLTDEEVERARRTVAQRHAATPPRKRGRGA